MHSAGPVYGSVLWLCPVMACFARLNSLQKASHKFYELRLLAGDFADRPAVHISRLNKTPHEKQKQTTTTLISTMIGHEARILMRQTNWNIPEIAGRRILKSRRIAPTAS